MSVKRVKVSDGVFTFDKVEIDTTKLRNMPAVSKLFAGLSTQSRIEKLVAFANAADATDPAVALRLSRMRDYIAEAGEGAIHGRYGRAGLALIGRAEQMRREIEALPYTLKGVRFTGNKRRLSLLYREAVAVLEREGVKLSTKQVRSALEKSGVIRDDSGMLRWTDDAGRNKTTSWKQFDTSLSRHRSRIR